MRLSPCEVTLRQVMSQWDNALLDIFPITARQSRRYYFHRRVSFYSQVYLPSQNVIGGGRPPSIGSPPISRPALFRIYLGRYPLYADPPSINRLPPPRRDTVNKGTVCIPLECIQVFSFCFKLSIQELSMFSENTSLDLYTLQEDH